MPDNTRMQNAAAVGAPGGSPRQCRRLGEMLVSEGVISEGQLAEAVAAKDNLGGFIGRVLVELGYIRQDTLIEFLVKQCKIPHIRLLDYDIGPGLLQFVPRAICERFNLLPIDKLGRILTVAMVDPLDMDALEELRGLCPDLRIKPILCSWQDFAQVTRTLFGKPAGEHATAESFGLAAAKRKASGPKKERPERVPHAIGPGSTPEPAANGKEPESDAARAEGGAHTGAAAPVRRRETLENVQVMELAEAVRQAAETAGAALRLAQEARGERHDADFAGNGHGVGSPRRPHTSVASLHAKDVPVLTDDDERVLAALHSESPLERYTFESFYADKGNAFTYEICKAIGEKPGEDYNPFFLYGEVGVGKTHLVNAIGNAALQGADDRRVGYVPASLFAERLRCALQDGAVETFREDYCRWDLLILDDIQFLGGHAEAQEEFFHVFNMLSRANRQIIIAADKPPDALGQLEKRLVSRFSSGIVAHLKPPEWETRMAILENHVKESKVAVPKEVLSLVATRVPRDVRKMTGALRKIVAFATLVGQDISSEIATEILSHLGTEEAA